MKQKSDLPKTLAAQLLAEPHRRNEAGVVTLRSRKVSFFAPPLAGTPIAHSLAQELEEART